MTQLTAQENLGLDPHKKTILILGGSQGSIFLNNYIKQLIIKHPLVSSTINVIHQTGSLDSTNWSYFYKKNNITATVFSYNPNLASVYCAADVIICRAGAGTLFEIEFFKKKCIIIPLKTNTTDHQIDNARAMSTEHPDLFVWLDQQDIEKKPEIFFSLLKKTLEN